MSVRFRINWPSFAVLFVGCIAWLGSANTAQSAPSAPGEPATWSHHDLIVTFNHLPKRYSCNDLWYRFHDLLLAIGARPDMEILPYRCERALGEAARSPSVQLNFQLPEVLQGKLQRFADLRVVKSTVTLEPGHPQSFDASDCDFVRQIKNTLLARIDPATSYRLACRSGAVQEPKYSLSVLVLIPVDQSETRVATLRRPL